MILDVGQTCDLKPTHPNHFQNIPKSYQNHIKIVSKSYQKRIKIVSKSYQNDKNLRQIDQKPVPGLFLFLFLKPAHWNHIKTGSESYQNRIKIVSKPYQNHIEIITPNSKHIKFISSNRIQNHTKIVKTIFPEFSILEGFRAGNYSNLHFRLIDLNLKF